MRDRLIHAMAVQGVAVPSPVLQKLADYAALLQKWNKTYNLTAIRDADGIVGLHLMDSLAILPYLNAEPVLDVGSGAGLPGIPLAIVRPDLSVTLLDANTKKSAFQRQAAIELGLDNVTVVAERVEHYQPTQPFGQIVSRAFADLSQFVELTRSLLSSHGRWLAMKGEAGAEELQHFQARCGTWAQVVDRHSLAVAGVEAARHLVVIERVRS